MPPKIVNMSILLVLFALSFLILDNLPNYIRDSANYTQLVYVLWTLGFSVAFVEAGIKR